MKDFKEIPYNKRQLLLIRQKAEAYSGSLSSLNNLITDLEGLLNCLEDADEDWKDSFYQFWQELEIIYSFAVHEGKAKLEEKEQKIIRNNLEKILKLAFFEKSEDDYFDDCE